MTIHKLKIWPQFYEAVADGHKPFEVRKDDRGYKVGDLLELHEFDPHVVNPEKRLGQLGHTGPGVYTGRSLTRYVSYIMRGGQHGIAEGFVVLGLSRSHPGGCHLMGEG